MLVMVIVAIGLYVATALLVRLPRLSCVTLEVAIAAALLYRDERCAERLCAAAATGHNWVRDARAQRALNRATRSALSLTAHVTSAPLATHHAVAFMRKALRG